jgi:hypothetical protein
MSERKLSDTDLVEIIARNHGVPVSDNLWREVVEAIQRERDRAQAIIAHANTLLRLQPGELGIPYNLYLHSGQPVTPEEWQAAAKAAFDTLRQEERKA